MSSQLLTGAGGLEGDGLQHVRQGRDGLTDTKGRTIWVNPDAVALLEEEEDGKTNLYFANADIPMVVIRSFAEGGRTTD